MATACADGKLRFWSLPEPVEISRGKPVARAGGVVDGCRMEGSYLILQHVPSTGDKVVFDLS